MQKPVQSTPEYAPGRLPNMQPVGVIDIGSNSVRLVVFEGLTRSPVPLFNEKILAGLGKNIGSSGKISREVMQVAGKAVSRFHLLAQELNVQHLHVLATAAVRDAINGQEFMAGIEQILGQSIQVISGEQEAQYAAYGVMSGFLNPQGIVGDLGGGSVELVPVNGRDILAGESLPLGGLRLAELAANGDMRVPERFVKTHLKNSQILPLLKDQKFYAVGGSWRSLAKLHMAQRNYPLRVMHNYTIPAKEALEFTRMVMRADVNTLPGIQAVSNDRRALLPFGAMALEEIIQQGKPKAVTFSALGVREGLLYSLLPQEEQAKDPLIYAAEEFALLRSRSPRYVHELLPWTDGFMAAIGVAETAEDIRLRHAACLLSDLSWRAHPDYRGEQSFNIIAHAAFTGVNHEGRAFLALAAFYRHAGLNDEPPIPALRDLLTPAMRDRAKIIGALIRVAHAISACTPDVILQTKFAVEGKTLSLIIPAHLADLAIQRLNSRMKQLGKLLKMGVDVNVQ